MPHHPTDTDTRTKKAILVSPALCPKRPRYGGDEVGSFLFEVLTLYLSAEFLFLKKGLCFWLALLTPRSHAFASVKLIYDLWQLPLLHTFFTCSLLGFRLSVFLSKRKLDARSEPGSSDIDSQAHRVIFACSGSDRSVGF